MILECVHVTTQEESEEVTKFLNTGSYKTVQQIKCDCIIYLDSSGFDRFDRYKEPKVYEKYKLITFEEFLEKYKHIKTNKQSMEKQMLDVLNKTYDNLHLRRTTVPLFMSNPGIGKTSIIQKFAKDKGVKLVKITLSQRMPNEVVGMVMPDVHSKALLVFNSHELEQLNDGDVLFFDEVFNGTLKQTLDALLNLLEDRTLPTGKKLADVMIVAASNPQGLINLTPQIKQRFEREDLKFNVEEFQVYLKNKYGMPESISSHLCTLINKEKFEPNDWNFVTPRSVEKAINKIGCELVSNYDDALLPFLTKTIESPMDISKLNVKKGDQVEYLNILKLLIANSNVKLRDTEEVKYPELKVKRLKAEEIAKERAEKQAAYEKGLAEAKAQAEAEAAKKAAADKLEAERLAKEAAAKKAAEEKAKTTSTKNKPKKTTQVKDDSTNHKQESGVTSDLLN